MLTESEARVLLALEIDPAEALTTREIAARAEITATTVRATSYWLASVDFVSQTQDRPAAWQITEAGRRALTIDTTTLLTGMFNQLVAP